MEHSLIPAGNGRQDLTTIINANNNGFVGVAIQYRVSLSTLAPDCTGVLKLIPVSSIVGRLWLP